MSNIPCPRRTLSCPVDQKTAGKVSFGLVGLGSVTQTKELAVISGTLMKLVKSLVIGGTVTCFVTTDRTVIVDDSSVTLPIPSFVLAP
ncbi:hypothetical protein [Pseudomonas sp. MF6776]|uniref:hypothetical protein n=1 Tax=Pseudomonas sp. MF6776 TaxID=2797534 RepID=UPI00190CEDB9|nr:hypothetical protein [Pseudomonas sp. MF6776]MBK3468376.1 hypothetical protein [Pseudomonas sp. MF6776]